MGQVSLFRLYALRALYLVIATLMGGQIWPLMLHHRPWELMHGVANCMLAAMTALALLGVRYPLQMLPLLFVELFWKATWLIVIALPLVRSGAPIDADTRETILATGMGIIIPILIPWGYVWANYVRKPGDRWA